MKNILSDTIGKLNNKSKEISQRVRARVQYNLYTIFSNWLYSSAESLSRQTGLNITQEYKHPPWWDYKKLAKLKDHFQTKEECEHLLEQYILLNPELKVLDGSKPQYAQWILCGMGSKFRIKDIQFFCTVIGNPLEKKQKEMYDKRRDAFLNRFGIQDIWYCPHPDTLDELENFILKHNNIK